MAWLAFYAQKLRAFTRKKNPFLPPFKLFTQTHHVRINFFFVGAVCPPTFFGPLFHSRFLMAPFANLVPASHHGRPHPVRMTGLRWTTNLFRVLWPQQLFQLPEAVCRKFFSAFLRLCEFVWECKCVCVCLPYGCDIYRWRRRGQTPSPGSDSLTGHELV